MLVNTNKSHKCNEDIKVVLWKKGKLQEQVKKVKGMKRRHKRRRSQQKRRNQRNLRRAYLCILGTQEHKDWEYNL